MLKKVLLALVVLVLLVVALVATRPAEYHVERVTTVTAPPAEVFRILSDFREWRHFSPWQKLDPNQEETYSGSERGKGAGYAWKGNDAVGEGRMTITDVKEDAAVTIQLEFLKPFASTSTTQFKLESTDGVHTRVTWAMDGKNDFMGKAFGLVVDMDAMLGKDFAAGLAALKETAERAALARGVESVPVREPELPAEGMPEGEDAAPAGTGEAPAEAAVDAPAEAAGEAAVDAPAEAAGEVAVDAPSAAAP